MYAHEYIYVFFTKYEYFMYFFVYRFFSRYFSGSGPVHILGSTGSMTSPVLITLVRSAYYEETKVQFSNENHINVTPQL